MKFGPAPVGEDLAGAILAHSTRTKARLIHKGAVLDAESIALLRDSGFGEVVVARLDPDDVPEAEAASRLGALFAGESIRVAKPVHGRVNVFATEAGLFRADREAIDALNALDESITLGTLPDATPVAEGDMLATLKIIPFAVPKAALDRAGAAIRAHVPLKVAPFRPLTVGLVLSRLPHLKDKAITATIEATRGRIERRGGVLVGTIETPHETAPIVEAILTLREKGARLILIAGASAVVDREDVTPSAIVGAGGTVTRFGMPVDPGNLLCFGTIEGDPAIVLPGCARSPKLNGIDFVLDRIFAGEPVGDAAIAGMGVGGLLKDFTPRPEPRIAKQASNGAPRVAAVVLAAGTSSRAAPANKLLVRLPGGQTLLGETVDHVLASKASSVIVVTGHVAPEVEAAVEGRAVAIVHAPDYATGMAASLKAGITAVPKDAAAALVVLGDMPLVSPGAIDRLIDAYDPDEGRTIVVPTHRGRRGNPVLWDRRHFPEIMALTGDEGARRILERLIEEVTEVAMDEDSVLRDFDTRDALAALGGGQ